MNCLYRKIFYYYFSKKFKLFWKNLKSPFEAGAPESAVVLVFQVSFEVSASFTSPLYFLFQVPVLILIF